MAPTTEMEVAVARALAVADRVDPDAASLVGMKTMRCWEARIPQARAAIRAMREPNVEMMFAGVSEWAREDDPEMDVEKAWQAMIDAASPTPLPQERTAPTSTPAEQSSTALRPSTPTPKD